MKTLVHLFQTGFSAITGYFPKITPAAAVAGILSIGVFLGFAIPAIQKSKDTKTPKFQRGFTLIEMLIVVAIIGILVGIAVPALNTAKHDAQESMIKARLAQIKTAKSRYVLTASVGDMPTSEEQRKAAILPFLHYDGEPITHFEKFLTSLPPGQFIVGSFEEDPQFVRGGNPEAQARNTPPPITLSDQVTGSSDAETYSQPKIETSF